MLRSSPVHDAFRLLWRRPGLVMAELAWRWSFAVAVWAVVIFAAREALDAVEVSGWEMALAQRSDWFLLAVALARSVAEALPLFLGALLIAIPCLVLLWIVVAAVGRGMTLAAIMNTAGRPVPLRLRPLLAINALRALVAVAAFSGWFGGMIIAFAAFPPTEEGATAAVLFWLAVALVIAVCWSALNWFLSLAPIFVLRDGCGAWSAIASAVGVFPRGETLSISGWFSLFKTFLGVAAFFAGLVALGLAGESISSAIVLTIMVVLVYSAASNWLHLGRLAAFVFLAGDGAALPDTTVTGPSPPPLVTTESEMGTGPVAGSGTPDPLPS